MSKKVLEALEFEKNKREILKMNSLQNTEATREYSREKRDGSNDPIPGYGQKRYAWEIELENYRKSKWKERFFFIGAVCGILALALTILLNFEQIKVILMKFS